MSELELKKARLAVMRAKSNIEEKEIKILERHVDIKRIEVEIDLHKKILEKNEKTLKELEG
jgi:hypothetical protein